MDISIDVAIYDYQTGGNLRLSDRVTINDANFMTMSQILGRFHEILLSMKEAAKESGKDEA
jgi:hypothetical protein